MPKFSKIINFARNFKFYQWQQITIILKWGADPVQFWENVHQPQSWIANHIFCQSFFSVKLIFHRKKQLIQFTTQTSAFLEDDHHTLGILKSVAWRFYQENSFMYYPYNKVRKEVNIKRLSRIYERG